MSSSIDSTGSSGASQLVHIAGLDLEVQVLGQIQPGAPALVFLHEGLGCVALWRDFPARLVQRTGLPTLLYSRRGYGRSQRFAQELQPGFMHEEARQVLPQLLARFGIDRPVLIGHSDGASIALIFAGEFAQRPLALVAMAPHLFVERITVDSIARIAQRFEQSDLPGRMARYHDDARSTFGHWTRAWLSPAFATWNIEDPVARVRCPVLALQGRRDEYGTLRQIHRIAELAPQVRLVELDNCGHSPFIDAPERVLDEIVAFLEKVAITPDDAAP